MNEKDYLEQRVDDQINWYNKKSVANKKGYRICQLILIAMAALVTLSGMFVQKDYPWIQYAVPVFGAIIAIVTGILALVKYQDNWLSYRMTNEALKHEKYLFLTKSEPYNSGEAFQLFVKHCEATIAKENTTWEETMKKIERAKKKV